MIQVPEFTSTGSYDKVLRINVPALTIQVPEDK